MLGRLRRFLCPSICADSFEWCSLSMISTWSHKGRRSPFSLHMWSATPDFSTSSRITRSLLVFLKPYLKGAACFSFIFPSKTARDSVHTVFSHVLLCEIDNILRKNQNGFRRNRSTTSQILTIRRILEGVRAKNLQAWKRYMQSVVKLLKVVLILYGLQILGIFSDNPFT